MNQDIVYQRIGEFTVCFQWLENAVRQIGWQILDPNRTTWPPKSLRKETNEQLVEKVAKLFLDALPKCNLGIELEGDLQSAFSHVVANLHELRKSRNRLLHSAFIELKAGREVDAIMRATTRLAIDPASGEDMIETEILSESSFDKDLLKMGETAVILNRCLIQLIHRYPR